MSYTYEYPRPAVTVDCVVFGMDDQGLKVLLIRRDLEPYRSHWALPGGFVEMEEGLDAAARRELEEETGLKGVYLEQLYTFGDVGRDPRGRVISVAYYALVKLSEHPPKAASDAREAAWFGVRDIPALAFDHKHVLQVALERLRGKVRYCPIGVELLPAKFTLTQLQRVYEVVLERNLDKRNFRKKILSLGCLVELPEMQRDVSHRAARLYRFDRQRYKKLQQEGIEFEV